MFDQNKLIKLSFGLSLGTILSLAAGINFSAVAQDTNNGYQSNEKDALYGDAPAGLNPLDLMHRAQQLNGRNVDEFNADSQTQLNNSVSDFKRLQQQRILQRQQPEATEVVKEEVE